MRRLNRSHLIRIYTVCHSALFFDWHLYLQLEAQEGQKSLTWIRVIMICYIVPWWPSWLSDKIGFSSSESDVVWRVSRLQPWPPSWILELDDFSISESSCHSMHPIKFRLKRIYGLAGHVAWKISRWPPPSWISERVDFSNSYLHIIPMLPIKLKLNPTNCSGADVIWRFSRWLPWWPSWISRRDHFCFSKCPDAFHQISAQSEADNNWRFSRQRRGRPSWISLQNDFSNSESPCHSNASHQVFAHSDLSFGSRCDLKIIKLASVAAILDFRTERF